MRAGTPRTPQFGFSLIEVLIAAAIFIVVSVAMLASVHVGAQWMQVTALRNTQQAEVGRLIERWQAESRSAWAIFTPPTDVMGNPDTDGHELDFFLRDGRNRPVFWAYYWNKTAQTVTRFLYAPGKPNVQDGDPIQNVTQFDAQAFSLGSITDSSSPVYLPIFDPTGVAADVNFGYGSSVIGGNRITNVRIATLHDDRSILLETGTAPSGFTVVMNYTPAPTATPLKSALVTEPASLEFPPDVKSYESATIGGVMHTCLQAGVPLALDDAGLVMSPSEGAQYGLNIDGNGCDLGSNGNLNPPMIQLASAHSMGIIPCPNPPCAYRTIPPRATPTPTAMPPTALPSAAPPSSMPTSGDGNYVSVSESGSTAQFAVNPGGCGGIARPTLFQGTGIGPLDFFGITTLASGNCSMQIGSADTIMQRPLNVIVDSCVGGNTEFGPADHGCYDLYVWQNASENSANVLDYGYIAQYVPHGEAVTLQTGNATVPELVPNGTTFCTFAYYAYGDPGTGNTSGPPPPNSGFTVDYYSAANPSANFTCNDIATAKSPPAPPPCVPGQGSPCPKPTPRPIRTPPSPP